MDTYFADWITTDLRNIVAHVHVSRKCEHLQGNLDHAAVPGGKRHLAAAQLGQGAQVVRAQQDRGARQLRNISDEHGIVDWVTHGRFWLTHFSLSLWCFTGIPHLHTSLFLCGVSLGLPFSSISSLSVCGLFDWDYIFKYSSIPSHFLWTV